MNIASPKHNIIILMLSILIVFVCSTNISRAENFLRLTTNSIDSIAPNPPKGLTLDSDPEFNLGRKGPNEKISNNNKYYVDSENGKDTNDGKSHTSPWKSIEKVNEHSFEPGDYILFKRGGKWYNASLKISQSNLTVSAYGDGQHPELIGAKLVQVWEHVKDNIYRTWSKHKDTIDLLNQNEAFFYYPTQSNSLLTEHASAGQFFHDRNTGYVYINYQSNENPSTNIFLIGSQQHIIELTDTYLDDIVIKNLKISYSNRFGIAPWYQSGNRTYGSITIQDNIFLGNAYSAVALSGTNTFQDVNIINNTIRNNGAEGIYIGKNNTRNEVRILENTIGDKADTFFGWRGEGNDSAFNGDGIDIKTGNNLVLIQNNIIENLTGGFGISSQTGNTLIEGNIIRDIHLEDSDSVAAIEADPQDNIGPFVIRNNTISSIKSHGITVRGSKLADCLIIVQHNMIEIQERGEYSQIGLTSENNTNIHVLENNGTGGKYGLFVKGETPKSTKIINNFFQDSLFSMVIIPQNQLGLTLEGNLDNNGSQ